MLSARVVCLGVVAGKKAFAEQEAARIALLACISGDYSAALGESDEELDELLLSDGEDTSSVHSHVSEGPSRGRPYSISSRGSRSLSSAPPVNRYIQPPLEAGATNDFIFCF